MRFYSILLAVALLTPNSRAVSGVANGGDVVVCNDKSLPVSAYYSLDYLLTHNPAKETMNKEILEVKRAREILVLIAAQLQQKLPDLSRHFEDFIAKLDNHQDWSQNRIWISSYNSLADIKDENITQKLDRVCRPAHQSNGTILVSQAVIRSKVSILQYEFDSQIYAALDQSPTPYQLSFLLVHEWLWDLTNNVSVIRNVNRYLHSEDFRLSSAQASLETLVGMGVPRYSIVYSSDYRKYIQLIQEQARSFEDMLGTILKYYRNGEMPRGKAVGLSVDVYKAFRRSCDSAKAVAKNTLNFTFSRRLQPVISDLDSRVEIMRSKILAL